MTEMILIPSVSTSTCTPIPENFRFIPSRLFRNYNPCYYISNYTSSRTTIEMSNHKSRISVGSTLKYSPIPPHTPAIILFFFDLYNLFI
jgi:hypothetical protein